MGSQVLDGFGGAGDCAFTAIGADGVVDASQVIHISANVIHTLFTLYPLSQACPVIL